MGFVFGARSARCSRSACSPGPGQAGAPVLRERYVEFITLADDGAALRKVTHQQVDLLLELRAPERYWVNTDSRQGLHR